MNMFEMVLALFAVVLFTSISLSYNQAIWAQTDYLNNATTVVQASQICHAMLDEIDAKLFSGQINLTGICTNYNFTRTQIFSDIPITFTVESIATRCDEWGQPLAAGETDSPYRRVEIKVSGHSFLKRPYSMHRLYTETFVR